MVYLPESRNWRTNQLMCLSMGRNLLSIHDKSSEAMQLIRTIVNQEMLHMQLAANLLNAYQGTVSVTPPVYGQGIPHLDFDLNTPDPTKVFSPWSSDIGPMDETRLNTMCLIEYPNWPDSVDPSPDATTYGSIGAFYRSVAIGAEELKAHIVGNRNQLNVFANFYPDFDSPTVTKDGAAGWSQVQTLINAIVSQGEGRLDEDDGGLLKASIPWLEIFGGFVPPEFQNQADDLRPQADHFEKFVYLKGQPLPAHFSEGPPTPAGKAAQARLVKNFKTLCDILQAEFNGTDYQGQTPEFSPIMFQVGGDIVSCWRHGAIPTFS